MIKADEARKIKITIWYKLIFALYLLVLDRYIKVNAKKGKNTLLYNEYFLMRIFFMKWQENRIDKIAADKGYKVFGMHDLKGISW